MFKPEDFTESIDDMCDDALRRLLVYQEGHFDGMRKTDVYYSSITRRDPLLNLVEYDTIASAEIIDGIHNSLVKQPKPADYFARVLGGAIVVLARNGEFYARSNTVIVPDQASATDKATSRWMTADMEAESTTCLSLYSCELGSNGLTTLELAYDTDRDSWLLNYRATRSVARFLRNGD